MMMNLFVKRAVATLVLAAQAVGMGTAAQAAGANTGAAEQAAPVGAVVQAMGTLHDSEPPVKPTPPTPPSVQIGTINIPVLPPEPVYVAPGHLFIEKEIDPSWSEEEKAKVQQENEAWLAQQKADADAYDKEDYARWKATVYAQWEAECQRLWDEAKAEAEAEVAPLNAAEWARFNAEMAQYQKDLAQWEIAYAQWEKEQAEAQNKPTPEPAPAPTPPTMKRGAMMSPERGAMMACRPTGARS